MDLASTVTASQGFSKSFSEHQLPHCLSSERLFAFGGSPQTLKAFEKPKDTADSSQSPLNSIKQRIMSPGRKNYNEEGLNELYIPASFSNAKKLYIRSKQK